MRDWIPAGEKAEVDNDVRRSDRRDPMAYVPRDYIPPKGEEPVVDRTNEEKVALAAEAADRAQARAKVEERVQAKARLNSMDPREAIGYIETLSIHARDMHLRVEYDNQRRTEVLDRFTAPEGGYEDSTPEPEDTKSEAEKTATKSTAKAGKKPKAEKEAS